MITRNWKIVILNLQILKVLYALRYIIITNSTTIVIISAIIIIIIIRS